ncbi:MAG: potassium channel protein, partial [Acidimicrobiia bacterium]|nr:potassium channel protein [Acidimicrobiia bacterium]
MLKSLGATMAQVTQRLRTDDMPSESGRHDRAQHVARRAERRRRLKTMVTLTVIFVVLVGVFSSVFH